MTWKTGHRAVPCLCVSCVACRSPGLSGAAAAPSAAPRGSSHPADPPPAAQTNLIVIKLTFDQSCWAGVRETKRKTQLGFAKLSRRKVICLNTLLMLWDADVGLVTSNHRCRDVPNIRLDGDGKQDIRLSKILDIRLTRPPGLYKQRPEKIVLLEKVIMPMFVVENRKWLRGESKDVFFSKIFLCGVRKKY